jgi:hypothetical protein
MQNIYKKMKTKNTKISSLKLRGFTMGLALIIVAVMLLISVSISTLLLRDLKNSASNVKSAIAYNLAESGLECMSAFENNIKYIDSTGNIITGLFPTSTSYVYGSVSYNSAIPLVSPGYANKDWQVTSEIANDGKNEIYKKDSIKCFGIPIIDNVVTNPANFPLPSTVTTLETVTASPSNGPASFVGGVVTHIKIKKDESVLMNNASQDSFQKYLQNGCLDMYIYSKDVNPSGVPFYKKLLVSKAFVPCTGSDRTERSLVRYMN